MRMTGHCGYISLAAALALLFAPAVSRGLSMIMTLEHHRFSDSAGMFNECLEKEKKAAAEKSPETPRLTEDRKIAAIICKSAAMDALSESGQEILRRQLESGEPVDDGKFYTADGCHYREIKVRKISRLDYALSAEAEFEMISKLRRTKSGEFEISAPRVRPGDKISVKAGTIGGGKAAAQAKDSSVTDAKGAAELRAVRMLKDEYGAITYVTDPSPETALRIEPLDGKLKFISQKGEGGKDILVPSWSDIDSIVINGEEYRIKLELRFPGE
jgi:hypothetical protein